MTFAPSRIDEFQALFDATASLIRRQPGCHHLELWRDVDFHNIMTTYSMWRDEAALDAYRKSELFKDVWGRTRLMFAAPPLAVSYVRARRIADEPGYT